MTEVKVKRKDKNQKTQLSFLQMKNWTRPFTMNFVKNKHNSDNTPPTTKVVMTGVLGPVRALSSQ